MGYVTLSESLALQSSQLLDLALELFLLLLALLIDVCDVGRLAGLHQSRFAIDDIDEHAKKTFLVAHTVFIGTGCK